MNKFNINLASSRALFLFNAAAQTGSFSHAAELVHVGQPAVSHSVRQLEKTLGVKLFQRLHRGVELTPAGEILARRVNAGLQEIRSGIEEVRATHLASERVTLVISTSMASYWLMPRLAKFKLAQPHIDLRCIARDNDRDIPFEDFDLCIALGGGNWPNMHRWLFAEEELFPICSAEYLASHPPLEEPTDLLHHELLHLEEHYHPRFNWQKWFKHFGMDRKKKLEGWTSNDYSIVIQAVQEGQGVAIGWGHLVRPLVKQGLLVRPIKESIKTGNPFYVIAPLEKPLSANALKLKDWLIAEMSQSV